MPPPTLAELPPPPAGKTGWPWTEAGPGVPPALPSGQPWPRVTVVTPSFNQAEFLEETLRSVLLQGYPNLEYFVMDGGSTDHSADIIRRYAPWLTGWRSAPDGGQSQAVNEGYARGTGAVLGWLNSDDVYLPGAVAAAAEAMAAEPGLALLYGDADKISRTGEHLGPAIQVRAYDQNAMLDEGNLIAQPAAFCRRTAFVAAGQLDEHYHYSMDYDLWLRLAEQGGVRYWPVRLAQMRIYPEAKSSAGGRKQFGELLCIVRRHGRGRLPAFYERQLVYTHLNLAFDAYAAGQPDVGAGELAYVIDMVPEWRASPARLAREVAARAWRAARPGEDETAAVAFAKRVLAHLPANTPAPAAVRRQALALLYEAIAFRQHERGARRGVWRYAWRAVAADSGRLTNRGLWSITLRALLPR